MTKEELLLDLREHTYVMARPSGVHGNGVFAIRDIPKGCRDMFSKGVGEWIKITKAEVASLPDYSKRLIETYCLWDDENYFVPNYGFKVMDLVNYLNHSDEPNVISINDGEFFETITGIKTGEELFIDYGVIVEE